MSSTKIPSLFFDGPESEGVGTASNRGSKSNASPFLYGDSLVSDSVREEEHRREITMQGPVDQHSQNPNQQRQLQKQQALANNALDRELTVQRHHLHHNSQNHRPMLPIERSRDPMNGQQPGARSVHGHHETSNRMNPSTGSNNPMERAFSDNNPGHNVPGLSPQKHCAVHYHGKPVGRPQGNQMQSQNGAQRHQFTPVPF